MTERGDTDSNLRIYGEQTLETSLTARMAVISCKVLKRNIP